MPNLVPVRPLIEELEKTSSQIDLHEDRYAVPEGLKVAFGNAWGKPYLAKTDYIRLNTAADGSGDKSVNVVDSLLVKCAHAVKLYDLYDVFMAQAHRVRDELSLTKDEWKSLGERLGSVDPSLVQRIESFIDTLGDLDDDSKKMLEMFLLAAPEDRDSLLGCYKGLSRTDPFQPVAAEAMDQRKDYVGYIDPVIRVLQNNRDIVIPLLQLGPEETINDDAGSAWSEADWALAILIYNRHVLPKKLTRTQADFRRHLEGCTSRSPGSWDRRMANIRSAVSGGGGLTGGGGTPQKVHDWQARYDADSTALSLLAREALRPNSDGDYVCRELGIPLWQDLESFEPTDKSNFETALEKCGFVAEKGLPGAFLQSLIAKPFVILTGNSGTGKTKIAELLAAWLRGNESDGHELVAVGADWTDNRNVVGFVNHLRPASDGKSAVYQSTAVLDLLLRATANPSLPFFLILDEMNLSHVERYLADFLSAMESREGVIRLHSEGAPEEVDYRLPRFDKDSVGVPREVAYPRNLFLIGTVNVDETTYMFSPKVLDRAHVIEFQADAETIGKFLANPQTLQAMESAPEMLAAGFLALSKAARGIGAPVVEPLPPAVSDAINKDLKSILAILRRGRFEFAFRTAKELNSYLRVCRQLAKDKDGWDSGARLSKQDRDEGNVSWLSDLDDEILQKVLPRLHGSRSRVGNLVGALVCYFATGKEADALQFFPADGQEEAVKTLTDAIILAPDAPEFPRCFKKMQTMARVLVEEQFVSFIC